MATAKLTRARVLVAFVLSGIDLLPNDVVSVDEKTLKAHPAELDPTPEAVEAALASGGKEVSLESGSPDE
ncbi:hypothetical protein [Pseudogulbenkiania ferrooxidans]|uniref:Uncharacterized protein n=1 Tax=Pseudogulbenkiania ferrooxidans 2002 TaxID=279714 RepID=B9YYU2_9NEIS|nr:hypothetical protein [Pseudogulbenkiania ferrooxidans]EEG10295.1 conserved hypothetical protein [Pseudogulbenkiania ferrooxidans 2002]